MLSFRGLAGDVVNGWRAVRRRPGFAVAVVFTLGLGIGANTAVFSLVDAVILSPLPYEDSGNLYSVFERHTSGRMRLPSYPTFRDWSARVDGLTGFAFARGAPITYETDDHTGFLLGSFVTEGFFDLLGVEAELGRVLIAADYRPGAEGAVVISHRAWGRWFASDPGVLGTTLVAEDLSFTVVGVMPQSFAFPDWGPDNDLWIPMSQLPPSEQPALNQRGFSADSRVVARIEKGSARARAQQSLDAMAASLATLHPDVSAGWTSATLVPLKELEIQGFRTRLFTLWAAVLLVLLMCCLNLANLYLVRGSSRRQEYAVRAALGAPTGRIFRQVVVETLVLTTAGGALGVWSASRGIAWARSGGLADLPRITELTLDGAVLAFAVVLSLATAVAFALIATGRTRGAFIHGTVRASGHGSRWTTRFLSGIQATQVGMTFVLLLGAWLLGETFIKLVRVEPGYDPQDVLVVPVNPPSPAYDGERAAVELYSRLMDAIRAVPGVVAVALTNHGPGGLAGAPTPAAVGRAPQEGEGEPVYYRTISAGYFATMRSRMIAGREFTDEDLAGGEGPLIVNRALAARMGGPEAAVGQALGVSKAASSRADFGEALVGTVVGVVADLDTSETGGEPVPIVYVPFTHTPWAQVRILARTRGSSPATIRAVEDAVRSIEPRIPLTGPFVSVWRLTDIRASQRSEERLNAGLVGAFAAVALLLACIGMYGVTSFIVTLRRREMGVRMALGAAPRRVAAGVVRHAALVGAMGLLGGVATGAALSSLIAGLLFEVGPLDPGRYVAVALCMLALVALAAYVPARRAGQLDPALVLRSE